MTASQRLKAWVSEKHQGQLIKKSGAHYFSHLAAVAALAKDAVRLGYEIGLCHDLLEDTQTTSLELKQVLLSFGYSVQDADLITFCVIELTDGFTSAAYPNLSKAKRKELETSRLLTISPTAQTVKYADLIDNIGWVLKFNQKHAAKYLNKKQVLLHGLNLGDNRLRQLALALIDDGLRKTQHR